jgi:anti-anti-sigma factor
LPTLLTAARPADLSVRTIALRGTLDRDTGESLRADVVAALADGPVVVDLHEVTVCGIAGLRVLMACHRVALETRSPLVLAAPSAEVRAALSASGIGRHLPLCRSVSQAVEAVRQLAAVWAAVEGRDHAVTPAA